MKCLNRGALSGRRNEGDTCLPSLVQRLCLAVGSGVEVGHRLRPAMINRPIPKLGKDTHIPAISKILKVSSLVTTTPENSQPQPKDEINF